MLRSDTARVMMRLLVLVVLVGAVFAAPVAAQSQVICRTQCITNFALCLSACNVHGGLLIAVCQAVCQVVQVACGVMCIVTG